MEKCDGTRNTSIIPFDENGREKWSDKRKPHKSLLYEKIAKCVVI